MVGSGHRVFREYLLREAAEHADVWLLEQPEPTWQKPYIVGSTSVDTFDVEQTRQAALDLAHRHDFDGVFCYHEGMIISAATAARALGLPGPDPQAVAACRDKARTRHLLAAAGVAQPRFRVLDGDEGSAEMVARVGLPLVVKPRSLGASQGVIRVDRESELASAITVARDARQTGMTNPPEVLVEAYVDGKEISVDGYFHEGRYTPLFLARKRLGPAPFFEEMGHVVDGNDPLLLDEAVLSLLAGAHAALEMTDAITHTEIRLTGDGPVLIEVNGRLGGDLIPLLASRATGCRPAMCGIELALGQQPSGGGHRAGVAAIRFLQPDAPCIVRGVGFDAEAARRDGAGDVEFAPIVPAGTHLRLPPEGYASRYALLTATGVDAVQCERTLDIAASHVRLTADGLA
jgi:biotin carboxylase